MRPAQILTVMALTAVTGLGCNSSRSPIHIIPDMDNQPKYKDQGTSDFFENRSVNRLPPSGAVARGTLEVSPEFDRGQTVSGEFVRRIPAQVTAAMMDHGQKKYNTFCAPCHDMAGTGKGLVPPHGLAGGMAPPPNFHDPRIRQMTDGELFGIITNGVRTMPAYKTQTDASTRWAIVAYMRALQRSQTAKASDVPKEILETVQ